jgi:hypothetical protein
MAMYLDLDELATLTAPGGLISTARFSTASFRRSDHLGDRGLPLAESVRQLVDERCGMRPEGPIRLLTQLRYFGYYFSPLNLFYCYDEEGLRIEAVVAEVNNTPWNEQHCYVLWQGNRIAGERRLPPNTGARQEGRNGQSIPEISLSGNLRGYFPDFSAG